MEFMPKVLQAIAGDDLTVYAYFNDGTVRLLDVSPLVQQGGLFSKLGSPDFFRHNLTVINDTVAWMLGAYPDPRNCIDLDPIELYENCPVVSDPLEMAS